MANTYPFPTAGPVGIGTTTPLAPLHVLSGNAELALFQGDPTGGERAYIQITSSNSNYTWQISNQDASFGNTANGLAFVETTLPHTSAAIRVYFQEGGNVGVGVTRNGSARFAVANSGGTSVVQLQASGSAAGAAPALSIGYGTTYDAVATGDAGYIQADNPNLATPPALLLNPFGGAVLVGSEQQSYFGPGLSAYQPPDQYPTGAGVSRLYATQHLSSGNAGGNALASYALYTVAPYPADVSAAGYYANISGGTGIQHGNGELRALEAQTTRNTAQNSGAVTQAIYVGLHSEVSGHGAAMPPQNIGVEVESAGVTNDAALYILGPWYFGVLCDDGAGNRLFSVDLSGGIYAAGGNALIDGTGDLTTNGTIAAVNAVSAPPGKFYVDTTGHAYATSFTNTSSRAMKDDIAELESEAAG